MKIGSISIMTSGGKDKPVGPKSQAITEETKTDESLVITPMTSGGKDKPDPPKQNNSVSLKA